MEIKTAEETLNEVLEGYNKRPRGWKFASDLRGNRLILGPDVGYRLKLMVINPTENIGVGARIDDVDGVRRHIGGDFSFGLRPLSIRTARDLFELLRTGGLEGERHEMLSRVLRREPVPLLDIDLKRIGGVISGPFVSHPDLRAISKSQRELDERLALEVERKFREKYPMRASMFR